MMKMLRQPPSSTSDIDCREIIIVGCMSNLEVTKSDFAAANHSISLSSTAGILRKSFVGGRTSQISKPGFLTH
jgi:hypothetical protein